MRNYALSLASEVINSHMYNKTFSFQNSSKYTIAMYSKHKNLIYGEELKDINFTKDFYKKDGTLFIIDKSAQLHLGVKYIVIKDNRFTKTTNMLLQKVILFTILALLFIVIISFFLGKLFLKPIASERERLDKFIKDTTHELNTPITALLMSIALLKNENIKVVERIKVSSNRISQIYSDLCYLIKKDLPTTPQIDSLDINTIIQEQLLLQEGYAKSKQILITTDTQTFFYPIDQESATRLISNILSNALKYSKPNTKVTITLKENKLIIEDQGMGIMKEDLNLVRKRYFRANHSEGGFGIGLDIVNSIIQKYNIKLEITSIYGKGSIVTLTF